MPEEEIVSIKALWVYYNNAPVLEDINLSILANDFLAVIGPNGSGKTTLIKTILGLIKPGRGTVRVFGKSPAEGRRLIGYLPQKTVFDVNFPISVFEVALMGRYSGLFRRYTQEDRDATAEALRTVGMLEYRDRQIGALSGGQQQRVFIARSIAKEPRLLLLDEPMASIDPELQSSFYELLSVLKKKMAIVMVTHDIGVVSVHVDKIACFNRKLYYHGLKEGASDKLEDAYGCPIDLIAHGVPHRVLRRHEKK